MRIAVDAMGGDFAPGEIVAGAIEATRINTSFDKLILVGDKKLVEAELSKQGGDSTRIEVHHASEVVGMDEAPAVAIRRKKDSSIGRAVDMVKSGEADAVFSAGNTGAAVAATTLKLRTLEGVERPAIATVLPSMDLPVILLDAGANPQCSARMLAQFAAMGLVYSREILGIAHPSVGVLSIGEEQAKGNEVTKEAYRILDTSEINFAGNVESKELFQGKVSVVVCDGFVGNVVLKTSESVAKTLGFWLRTEFTANPIRKLGALLLKTGLDKIKMKTDPATYGGAPLLGINGVCIIGHGSSSARAVTNGIRVAGEAISHKVNDQIAEQVKALNNIES